MAPTPSTEVPSTDIAPPDEAQRSRRVARAAGIVMAGYLLADLTGFVRQLIIARAFGTSAEIDAYYAAFQLPDLLHTLISGGALAAVFIPVFSGYLGRQEREAGWAMASGVINLVLLVTALLALLVALAAPAVVRLLIAPGFDADLTALTAQLMRWILVSTLIFAVSGLFMAILNAHQHFLLPAFAPVSYNLGIMAGALWLAPRWGVLGLAWGVVAGAFLHLAVQLPGLVHFGLRYRPSLGLADLGVRRVMRLMGPRLLGLGVVKVNFVVMTNLASRLGEGSVAALNYGWLVMQLPETIFATALATAVFPTLSELASRGDRRGFVRAMSGSLRAILFLTVPSAVGLVLLGRPAIRLLFEGGAFGAESTEAVYLAVQFFALGLVTHASLEIAARAFFAQQDTLTPFKIAALAMLAHLVLSLVLMGPLGHGGLALANSLAVGLEVAGLLWVLRRRLGPIELPRLGLALGRAVLAAGAMGLALAALLPRLAPLGPLPALALAGGGGALVYGLTALLLRSEELYALPALLRRRAAVPADL